MAMIQRSLFGVLVLVVVVALTQCTVQKRVYRKGYYISFHKTPKNSSTPKEKRQLDDQSELDSTVTYNENEIQPIVRSTDVPASKTKDALEEQNHTNSTQLTPVSSFKATCIQAKENVKVTVKQVVLAKHKAKELKRPKRTAIALIMIALIITSLVIAFFGLSSLNGGALIVAVVLFLGAVIGLFVGLSLEYEEHKRNMLNQKPEMKQPEISTSDWETLKKKQRKIAVALTLALMVLYFSIVVLWLSSTIFNSGLLLLVIAALFLFFIALAWSKYQTKKT
jgi:uncharacterized membrane protein (DUF485 family)